MFNGARNIVVNGGSFVVNADGSTKGKLDRLLDEVAPNAILNAGGRADEVRCYPGTREEIIGKVEKWMDEQGADEQYAGFMWLSGPAGAGKSAIVQTVAERCEKRGIHAANFFFFRSDGTRNHAQPLVPTLVYQLLRLYPGLSDFLAECLTEIPLVYKASTDEQFLYLISSPIRVFHHSSLIHRPIILMIDGLDECDDKRQQEQVLAALYALVKEEKSPFRVLVASRAEHHLVMFFNKIRTEAESIFLSDEYRPQDDIRRFVIAKFEEIKTVHSLAHALSEHWPANADIDAITDKSSGQFIYAATVMRFIQYSPASPAVSLLRVHEMRPLTDHSPLAHVDMLYSYIFSKTRDIQMVKLMLGADFIIRAAHQGILFGELLQNGGYESIEVESFLADLAPIVRFSRPTMELVFYHASLFDYLTSESRSGIYHVDVRAISAEWASISLNKMHNFESWDLAARMLIDVKEPTPELSKTLLAASERKVNDIGNKWGSFCWEIVISQIFNMYFGSDSALFKYMLRRWIRFAYLNNIELVPVITGTFQRGPMTRQFYKYYKWYKLTEGLKFALRSH